MIGPDSKPDSPSLKRSSLCGLLLTLEPCLHETKQLLCDRESASAVVVLAEEYAVLAKILSVCVAQLEGSGRRLTLQLDKHPGNSVAGRRRKRES